MKRTEEEDRGRGLRKRTEEERDWTDSRVVCCDDVTTHCNYELLISPQSSSCNCQLVCLCVCVCVCVRETGL